MSQSPARRGVQVLPEPMVLSGSHEPLSFRRRAGHAAVNEAAVWEREHSPATIAALARRGVTWIRAHFFKGNGLAAEARKTADRRLILHLVNYRIDRPARRVSLELAGTPMKSARLFDPWSAGPVALRGARRNGTWHLSVGTIQRYAVVEITPAPYRRSPDSASWW